MHVGYVSSVYTPMYLNSCHFKRKFANVYGIYILIIFPLTVFL